MHVCYTHVEHHKCSVMVKCLALGITALCDVKSVLLIEV